MFFFALSKQLHLFAAGYFNVLESELLRKYTHMALIPVTNSVLIVLLLRDFVTLDVIPYLGGLPQLPVTSSTTTSYAYSLLVTREHLQRHKYAGICKR